MSTWKLQKLVYYSQAWHMTWEESPLFTEKVEAWANGPVVPDLYREHRGMFLINSWPKGDVRRLTAKERESIDVVLAHYGARTAAWLRELTHREPPWLDARAGLDPGERGSRIITPDAMAAYYGSL
jgi:uncharacterized phage-associated protein